METSSVMKVSRGLGHLSNIFAALSGTRPVTYRYQSGTTSIPDRYHISTRLVPDRYHICTVNASSVKKTEAGIQWQEN